MAKSREEVASAAFEKMSKDKGSDEGGKESKKDKGDAASAVEAAPAEEAMPALELTEATEATEATEEGSPAAGGPEDAMKAALAEKDPVSAIAKLKELGFELQPAGGEMGEPSETAFDRFDKMKHDVAAKYMGGS